MRSGSVEHRRCSRREGCTNSIVPLTIQDGADGRVVLSFLYRLAVRLVVILRLSDGRVERRAAERSMCV